MSELYESMTIYGRIAYKAKHELELDGEERLKLEDMLFEDFHNQISKGTDELLLQMASDRGLIL